MIMFPTPVGFPHDWCYNMRRGMSPFSWMHGWGFPARGPPCPNTQQLQGCPAPTNQTTPQEGNPGNPSQPCSDPNVAFLQNVGESVAAMLGPLGIDVDIDVEHGGKRSKVSTPPQVGSEPKDAQPSSSTSSTQNPQSGDNRSEGDSAPMDTDITKQMEDVHLNSQQSNEQGEHSSSALGSGDDWTHILPKVDPSTGELQSLQLLETDGPSPLDPSRTTNVPTALREAAIYPHLPAEADPSPH
ncbi:UBA domain [Pristimantis euphronides]